MRVIFDNYIFTDQKFGGISRYFFELIKSCNRSKDVKTLTPIIFSNNHYIRDKKDVKHLIFFPNKRIKGKQRLMFLINRIVFLFAIKKQDFDIVHPTYFDTYYLKYIGKKKLVLTVYDMIHEKFYEDKISKKKKLLCDHADVIIAISENTKNDLIEIFNIPESKIRVVYLASSLKTPRKVKTIEALPKKYILFVGSRSFYKNFERFIYAVSNLTHDSKEINIVCAGGNKFDKKEILMFIKLGIEKQITQINVNDDLLFTLYHNALLFVFPSLYEGFGIPIIEAFSCGCPVACSNSSSFPEIALDGAVYFDPMDEQSIYDCIHNIIFDDINKAKLVNNAYKRLENFSWEKTASQTKEIYKEVM